MTDAFEKAWGEGFRIHGFDRKAPGVTELVPVYGEGDKEINPLIGGYRSSHHMEMGRDSGTGVSGTYYHGGPFHPLWTSRADLERIQERVRDRPDDVFVHAKPKNPIATSPKMRDLSFRLLGNTLRNSGGNEPRERTAWDSNVRAHVPTGEWNQEFDDILLPRESFISGKYNTGRPIFRRLSDMEGLENIIDAHLRPYRMSNQGTLDYWSNIDDLAPPGGIKVRKPGQMSSETVGRGDHDGDLIRYLGSSPLVQRIYGNDARREDDWIADPDVLDALNERMLDLGGLSPMNILLSGLGHDAVAPLNPKERGSAYGGREVQFGSVLMPPAEDEWWEDYHPVEGGFNSLTADNVQNWLDEYDNTDAALAERLGDAYTSRKAKGDKRRAR